MERSAPTTYPMRRWLIIAAFVAGASLLLARAVDLQVVNDEFLRNHGDARSLRVISVPAHRGIIADRNGEPLAISTPVDSVWVRPRDALAAEDRLGELAAVLGMDDHGLGGMLRDRIDREFVYLKRHVSPDQARQVRDLGVPGVHLQREYRRYYPAGEIAAHLVGFTNVDDLGQEGAELAFDAWLRGTPGQKRVLKDRLGRTVRDVESIRPPDPGRALTLSIDRRIQYLAYRELKLATARHHARGGSLVMLDPRTGEIIAMAVQPSYNPNNRGGLKSAHFRNRAVTDVFEPGSTLKPFTIAAALRSGRFRPDTIVETGPGFLRVSDHMIRDIHDYGTLDVAGVIRKSSNVGASKIALALGPEPLWEIYSAVGFGRDTGSGFPGEVSGVLYPHKSWSEVELATISFGYGLSVTALQLAQAYAAIAADGIQRPVSMQRLDGVAPAGRQVLPANIAREVRSMMEAVTEADGTARQAAIRGYRIAGKTGTAHKAAVGGYAKDLYMSLFAGMAPAREPRLVLVVIIDEPRGAQYYGGQVAAPVFAEVMRGALRIQNVAPDDLRALDATLIAAAAAGRAPAAPPGE
jgi:cell division protein FtsI (penicillin-binding protein 3)